jgi:hypothetical protein
MNQLERLQDFYRNGTDPEFSPDPNHNFIVSQPPGGERVFLLPGHFYTFLALNPVGPDDVPTWDEYEIMRNPSIRDSETMKKYPQRLPYYDNRPIFLALSQDGWAIDVKIMSQALRKKFVRTYLMRMERPIANCFTDGELLPIRQRQLNPFLGINAQMIKTITGIPEIKYDLLINKYNRDQMRNLTLIDWPDVPKLHLANYSTDKTISARSQFSLFEIK